MGPESAGHQSGKLILNYLKSFLLLLNQGSETPYHIGNNFHRICFIVGFDKVASNSKEWATCPIGTFFEVWFLF
jgi:hypothetical protein